MKGATKITVSTGFASLASMATGMLVAKQVEDVFYVKIGTMLQAAALFAIVVDLGMNLVVLGGQYSLERGYSPLKVFIQTVACKGMMTLFCVAVMVGVSLAGYTGKYTAIECGAIACLAGAIALLNACRAYGFSSGAFQMVFYLFTGVFLARACGGGSFLWLHFDSPVMYVGVGWLLPLLLVLLAGGLSIAFKQRGNAETMAHRGMDRHFLKDSFLLLLAESLHYIFLLSVLYFINKSWVSSEQGATALLALTFFSGVTIASQVSRSMSVFYANQITGIEGVKEYAMRALLMKGNRAVLLTFLGTIMGGVVMYVLFKDKYPAAWICAMIMGVAAMFQAYSSPFTALTFAARKPVYDTLINFIKAVLLVALFMIYQFESAIGIVSVFGVVACMAYTMHSIKAYLAFKGKFPAIPRA